MAKVCAIIASASAQLRLSKAKDARGNHRGPELNDDLDKNEKLLAGPDYGRLELSEPVQPLASDVKEGRPKLILQQWFDYRCLVCVTCNERPLLAQQNLLSHIAHVHGSRFLNAELHKLMTNMDHLVERAEDIVLPPSVSQIQTFLNPPAHGWCCVTSSCKYNCEDEGKIDQHVKEKHPEPDIHGNSYKIPTMVQYVTSTERIYISIQPGTDEDNNYATKKRPVGALFPADVKLSLPTPRRKSYGFLHRRRKEQDLIAGPRSRGSSESLESIGSAGSIATSLATYQSVFDTYEDTYSKSKRKEILGSLWDDPGREDLQQLDHLELMYAVRLLALSADESPIRDFRRFDRIMVQTLLYIQHQIVLIEERLAQRDRSVDMNELVTYLNDYGERSAEVLTHPPSIRCHAIVPRLTIPASLIKSYKELSSMKQPGQKESREIGRRLATRLHEPRYWYAQDALELIDLRHEGKAAKPRPDQIRIFLQKHVPISLLDRVGKEHRDVDKAKARKELPSGRIPLVRSACSNAETSADTSFYRRHVQDHRALSTQWQTHLARGRQHCESSFRCHRWCILTCPIGFLGVHTLEGCPFSSCGVFHAYLRRRPGCGYQRIKPGARRRYRRVHSCTRGFCWQCIGSEAIRERVIWLTEMLAGRQCGCSDLSIDACRLSRPVCVCCASQNHHNTYQYTEGCVSLIRYPDCEKSSKEGEHQTETRSRRR